MILDDMRKYNSKEKIFHLTLRVKGDMSVNLIIINRHLTSTISLVLNKGDCKAKQQIRMHSIERYGPAHSIYIYRYMTREQAHKLGQWYDSGYSVEEI